MCLCHTKMQKDLDQESRTISRVTKERRPVSLEERFLENNFRILMKPQIVGCYLFLGSTIKGKNKRAKEISKEVNCYDIRN